MMCVNRYTIRIGEIFSNIVDRVYNFFILAFYTIIWKDGEKW